MNHNDAVISPPCWYCLWSRTLRQIVLDDDVIEDGVFQFTGPVPTFHDREDAERYAVGKRVQYPAHVIEVIPLPAAPPTKPLKPAAIAELAAIQVELSDASDNVGPWFGMPFGTLEIRLRRYGTPKTAAIAEQLVEFLVLQIPRFEVRCSTPVSIRLGVSPVPSAVPHDQESK